MVLIPVIVVPLLFIFGIYRLFQLIRRFKNGELRFNRNGGVLLPILTVFALITFALFTLSILVAYGYVFSAFSVDRFPIIKMLQVFSFVYTYPTIYFLAEWVFYYGLCPSEKIST